MIFRKLPVTVSAVQLRWNNWDQMCRHANVGRIEDGQPQGCWTTPHSARNPGDVAPALPTPEYPGMVMGLVIPTIEGNMVAAEFDWIVRGVEGELYPVKDAIFRKTYEGVSDEAIDALRVTGPTGELVDVPLRPAREDTKLYQALDLKGDGSVRGS